MIAHWMLYCAAVGALLGLGALALERGLAACGRPTRWAWLAAVLLTLAVPAAARLFPRAAAPAALEAPAPASPKLAPAAPLDAAPPADAPVLASARRRIDLAALDRPLLALWATSSAAVLLALAGMGIVLARRRRTWRAAEVDGVPVLVSPDTGPAVVGLLRSRIVLPEWACAAEGEARALMLAHEREHVRAGDARLVAAALLAAAALPWSPAVWWQLRRLRLAVEVDCDARVLRRRGDVRAYGALLLEVGRRAGGGRLAVAALSEPASFLERRIHAMTRPPLRRPWLRAAVSGAAAVALGVAACETPGPVQGSAAGLPRRSAGSALTPREAVARYYPEVLTRGMRGNDYVLFMVEADGRVIHNETGRRNARISGMARLAANPRTYAGRPEVEGVDVVSVRPGELGPDPLDIIWIRRRPASAVRYPTLLQGPEGGQAPLSHQPVDRDGFFNRIALHVPPAVRAEGVDGRARVRFTVGVDGRAKELVVEGNPHPEVARAALAAVSGTRFHPDLRGDTPVEGRTWVMMDFGTFARDGMRGYPRFGPEVSAATLEAAVRRHHPEVAAGRGAPEHWFHVDAAGRVVRTGAGGEIEGLRGLGSYGGSTSARVQVDGHYTAVHWIRLLDPRPEAIRGDSVMMLP